MGPDGSSWTPHDGPGGTPRDGAGTPPAWGHGAPPHAPQPPERPAPWVAAATPAPWAVPVAPPPDQFQQPSPFAPSSSVGAGPPGGRGTGRVVLAGAVAVLLAAAAAGVTWYTQRDPAGGDSPPAASSTASGAPRSSSAGNGDPTASAGSTTGSASAPRTPTSSVPADPAPGASTEDRALAELRSLRAGSLSRLVLDGRWVAQVASKSVGITDPLQVAANGTHTFYAVDILAESRSVVARVPSSQVLVLLSTDFGRSSVAADGQPYWVTVVDARFSGSAEVTAWCAGTYSSLTPEQLANACAPRTLSAPHS